MEAGCGVGNTIFPLFEKNIKNLKFFGFDISPTAIKLIEEHPLFSKEKIIVKTCDIVNEDLIYDNLFDFCTMIFFLSAIHPCNFEKVLKKIDNFIKKNGIIFFRDYGIYDLAMMRNHEKGNFIEENLYQKGDGTLAYYFSKEKLEEIFKFFNYECLELNYSTITIENKKRNLILNRVFITGKFIKK